MKNSIFNKRKHSLREASESEWSNQSPLYKRKSTYNMYKAPRPPTSLMRHDKSSSFSKRSSRQLENRSQSDMMSQHDVFGGHKIKIVCRVRPTLNGEKQEDCLKVVNVSNERQQQQEQVIRLQKQFTYTNFKLENIIHPKDTQDQAFIQVKEITDSFITQSISGTIFALQVYPSFNLPLSGQTGAGKTYSIFGNKNSGILPKTMQQVFQFIDQPEQNQKYQYQVWLSFYEIYNEKIYDLFKVQKKKLQLDIREDKNGNFNLPDLIQIQTESYEEAVKYIESGASKREIGSTQYNSTSSRSHSIFQIQLFRINKQAPQKDITVSKLRIVDLAGSEKYLSNKGQNSQEKEIRLQELTSINASLSTLGQCVQALGDPRRNHVPFRNSKLTKLLRDSLDGQAKIAIIVCVSPSIDNYKETFSTLQFADRAKKAVLDGRYIPPTKQYVTMSHSNSHDLAQRQASERGSETNIGTPVSTQSESKPPIKKSEKVLKKTSSQNSSSNQSHDVMTQKIEKLKQKNLGLRQENIELKKQMKQILDLNKHPSSTQSGLNKKKKRFSLQNNNIPHSTQSIKKHTTHYPTTTAATNVGTPQTGSSQSDKSKYLNMARERSGIQSSSSASGSANGSAKKVSAFQSRKRSDDSFNRVTTQIPKVTTDDDEDEEEIFVKRKTSRDFSSSNNKNQDHKELDLISPQSAVQLIRDRGLIPIRSSAPIAPHPSQLSLTKNSKGGSQLGSSGKKKQVHFASKLIENEESLDLDDLERIEHNQKYNDDIIFENFSLFQEVRKDLNVKNVNVEEVREKQKTRKKLPQSPRPSHTYLSNGKGGESEEKEGDNKTEQKTEEKKEEVNFPEISEIAAEGQKPSPTSTFKSEQTLQLPNSVGDEEEIITHGNKLRVLQGDDTQKSQSFSQDSSLQFFTKLEITDAKRSSANAPPSSFSKPFNQHPFNVEGDKPISEDSKTIDFDQQQQEKKFDSLIDQALAMNASSIKNSKEYSGGDSSLESKSQSAKKIKNFLSDIDDNRLQQFWGKKRDSSFSSIMKPGQSLNLSTIQEDQGKQDVSVGNFPYNKNISQLSNDVFEAIENGVDLSDILKQSRDSDITRNKKYLVQQHASSFEKKTNLFIKIDEEVSQVSNSSCAVEKISMDHNLETQKFLDILQDKSMASPDKKDDQLKISLEENKSKQQDDTLNFNEEGHDSIQSITMEEGSALDPNIPFMIEDEETPSSIRGIPNITNSPKRSSTVQNADRTEDDVLTYSLTNTFSTVNSLNFELNAALQDSLKSNQGLSLGSTQYGVQIPKLDNIYSKLNTEIHSLKSILNKDGGGSLTPTAPDTSPSEINSNQQQQNHQEQQQNHQQVHPTGLIKEIKKELLEVLHQNETPKQRTVQKKEKSQKILTLLEKLSEKLTPVDTLQTPKPAQPVQSKPPSKFGPHYSNSKQKIVSELGKDEEKKTPEMYKQLSLALQDDTVQDIDSKISNQNNLLIKEFYKEESSQSSPSNFEQYYKNDDIDQKEDSQAQIMYRRKVVQPRQPQNKQVGNVQGGTTIYFETSRSSSGGAQSSVEEEFPSQTQLQQEVQQDDKEQISSKEQLKQYWNRYFREADNQQ